MKTQPLVIAAAIALLSGAGGATASSFEIGTQIVINVGAGAGGARDIGADHPNVGRVFIQLSATEGSLCSGALISASTFVTARHCVDRISGGSVSQIAPGQITVEFTAQSGAIQQSSAVTSIARFGGGSEFFNGTDLSILTLATPPMGLTPFSFITDPAVGDLAQLVGYGWRGVDSAVGPGQRLGERWGAENTIDHVAADLLRVSSPSFAPSGGNALIYADFDDGSAAANTLAPEGSSAVPLAFEGTTGPGDSGGPLLVWRDGDWRIAGILTGALRPIGATSVTYGDISIWTGITSLEAQTFISDGGGVFHIGAMAAIPLPPAGVLLLGALGMLGLAGRARSGAALRAG